MDENTIIDVLVKRSNEQRQKIKEAYQRSSGKVWRETGCYHVDVIAMLLDCAVALMASLLTNIDCRSLSYFACYQAML